MIAAALSTAEPAAAQFGPKAKATTKTFPITVAGRALDDNGSPIKGATLVLASTNRSPRRKLAETTTDANGQYEFRDAALPAAMPILGADRAGVRVPPPLEGGQFQILGTAPKCAVVWTEFYTVSASPQQQRGAFQLGEKIDLDITFHPAARVWGRILAEDGKPVAGASVQVTVRPLPAGPGGFPASGFSAFMAPINFTDYLSTDPFRTTTNESGQFELASVPPEMLLTVSVNHADYGSTSLMTSTAAFPPEQSGRSVVVKLPVELKLRTGRVVTVAVQAADGGEPVAGAMVSATGTSGEAANSARGTSDKEGKLTIKLPPGSYRLYGDPPAGRDLVPATQDLVVEESPAEQSATLKINQGAILLFKAIDAETGKGILGVTFWHEPVDAARPPGIFGAVRTNLQATPRRTGFGSAAHTNAEGEFRAVVAPGQTHYGVGSYGSGFFTVGARGRGRVPTLPEGYQAFDAADLETGREIEATAGRPVTVEFKLLKVN